MSFSAVKAGRAFVEMFLDRTQLKRGLNLTSQELRKFGAQSVSAGTSLVTAGIGLLAPLTLVTKKFADSGSAFADIAARTGASVESISTLGFAAEQVGAGLTELEAGIRKSGVAIDAAKQGNESAIDTFNQLGLSVDALLTMSPEDRFRAIAKAVSQVPDPATRTALAMESLGKAGVKLIPLGNEIDALESQARSLGLEMSGEAAASADALGDAIGSLSASASGLANKVGAVLAPALTAVAVVAAKWVSVAGQWIDKNRGLVVAIAATGAGLVAVGGTLLVTGLLASATGVAFAALGGAVAFAFSPIGAGITLLVSAGAAFLTFSKTGRNAIGGITRTVRQFFDEANDVFGGIADAIAAGDLELAMTVATLGLKQVWTKGTLALTQTWHDFTDDFYSFAIDAIFGVQGLWADMAAGFQTGWAETVAFFSKTWTQATGEISKGILDIQGYFDESFDAEAAKKMIDEGTAKDVNRIESERLAKRKDIERNREAEQDALGELNNDTKALFFGDREKQINDLKAELDAAKAKFTDARTKAKAARDAIDGRGKAVDDAAEGGLGERRVTVAGTFSAFALRGLGGAGPTQKIVAATEETADGVKELVKLEKSRKALVFA